MAVQFVESGGQYHAGSSLGPGVWGSTNGAAPISNLPVPRNGSTWGYGQNAALVTPVLSATGFGGMIAAVAYYTGSSKAVATVIGFFDPASNAQCDLRLNISGQLFFTRNGTQIGGTSTISLNAGIWYYLEFKAIFSNVGAGTCEVRVNGIVALTATSVTNAQNANGAGLIQFATPNATSQAMMDFYALDTTLGLQTNYLGDVTVAEIYPNAPGVNAAWTVNQAAFTLTAVATSSGGTAVYTGTITNGATPANAWQGFYFTVAGFVGANNNGTFLCTASNATQITLANGAATAETHAATCSFQNPLQPGIHGGINDGFATTNVGIRPPNDNQFISSSTVGQISDFGHQTLVLIGSIAAVVHVELARKDDAGTRQIALVCLSAGTESDSATFTLSTTYQYLQQILETDPHTAAAWVLANFNAATFGVKEIA